MRKFKIKLSTLMTFVTATILGISLFWVSQQVQQLEREQRELSTEISSEQEGVRVLNAEWDYLNRPDRIEALAAKYLEKMTPVAPDNLLVNAKSVPEPQILQGEDEAPLLVSTDSQSEKPKEKMNAVPSARAIVDADDKQNSDFEAVLKDTEGDVQ